MYSVQFYSSLTCTIFITNVSSDKHIGDAVCRRIIVPAGVAVESPLAPTRAACALSSKATDLPRSEPF